LDFTETAEELESVSEDELAFLGGADFFPSSMFQNEPLVVTSLAEDPVFLVLVGLRAGLSEDEDRLTFFILSAGAVDFAGVLDLARRL
jgi:hypothetical protein